MKNWKVILLLLLFYPLGIYFMFKRTNWPKGVKYIVTVVLGWINLQVIFESLSSFNILMIFGILVSFIGLIAIVRNTRIEKNKRIGVGILFLGILLMTFSYQQEEKQNAIEEQQKQVQLIEQERQNKIALVKAATQTVEDAERQKNRENYKKAEELVRALKPEKIDLNERLIALDTYLTKEENIKEITLAIENAEKERTQESYEAAASLITVMDVEGTELKERLANVKTFIDEEKQKTDNAVLALKEAEESKKREDYDKADTLISGLAISNEQLTTRLREVETVVVAEETRKVEEKAEQDKKIAAAEVVEKEKQILVEEAKNSPSPSPSIPSAPVGGDVSSIDTNGNGRVTIPEAKAAGFSMPITSDHWLYQHMDDRDNDGMVGE